MEEACDMIFHRVTKKVYNIENQDQKFMHFQGMYFQGAELKFDGNTTTIINEDVSVARF